MTGTSSKPKPKRAAKRKTPSDAELRRQASGHKARADAAEIAANEAKAGTQELSGRVTGLEETLGSMASVLESLNAKIEKSIGGAAAAAMSEDARKQSIDRLGDEILNERSADYEEPEKPPAAIPPALARAKRLMDAKNNPVMAPTHLDTGDVEVGQFKDRTMSAHGDASEALDDLTPVEEVEVDGRRYTESELDYLLFMEEQVLVVLSPSADEFAEPLVPVTNDGRTQNFIRGREQWVARKFIEPLLRSRITTYVQDSNANEVEGSVFIPRTSLAYPIQVIKDTPRGSRWVRDILHSPM